jgi:putative sigma-54 modulation protein
MEITVQGLNMKVNDGITAYARKKLDRLDRYLPGITDVRLDLSTENSRRGGNLRIAQLTVYHRRGAILRVEEKVNNEFEIAINQAVDKMYRQITRFKGKRVNGRRRAGDRYEATVEELELAEALPEDATVEAVVEGEAYPEVVEEAILRRKVVNLTPMTEEEAIKQMELLSHDFFLFFNGELGTMSVLYKRDTGGYGLLIPKIE